MQADLKTAVDAAMHEWRTMPRWKRIELDLGTQIAFVHKKVSSLILGYRKCWSCSGSGIVAGTNEYEIADCHTCKGTGEIPVHPTLDEVKWMI